jgi:cell division protein FtsB
MFGVKTVTVVLTTVLVTALAISYFVYQQNQKTIAQLQENNAHLNVAVEVLTDTVSTLEQNNQIAYQINSELNSTLNNTRLINRQLAERLSRHDIGMLAIEKPQLIERTINRASTQVLRCFELLSGAPLNEREQNATTEREFNSECPHLFYTYRNIP